MKKSKYNSIPTDFNGVLYHSKKEAKRAKELDFMQANGIIKGLQRQVKFTWLETHQIGVNFEEKTISFKRSYIADFVYFDIEKKCDVVLDVKGFKTPEYKKKKKIVEKIFSIKIIEI